MTAINTPRYLSFKTENGSYSVDNPSALQPIDSMSDLYSKSLKHVHAMVETSGKHMSFMRVLHDDNMGFGIIHNDCSYNIVTETRLVLLEAPSTYTDADMAAVFFQLLKELVGILISETGPAKLDLPQIKDAMDKNKQYHHHITHTVTLNGLTVDATIATRCYQIKYISIN
jgi:hypothetical protein